MDENPIDQEFRQRLATIVASVEHGYAAAADVTDTMMDAAEAWRVQRSRQAEERS